MKININNICTVHLTPLGEAKHKEVLDLVGSFSVASMPLWQLMQIFGPGLHMAMTEMYFVNNEIEVLNNDN